jgi:lipopolysaccharide transport system permease protein
MFSPMVRRRNSHRIALQAPSGATVDFLFLITKNRQGENVVLWDLNGTPEKDFHTRVVPGGITEIDPTILPDQGQRGSLSLSRNSEWAVGGAIALVVALAVGKHLQRVTQCRALNLSMGPTPVRRRLVYLRDLLRELVAREMKVQYKRSALGIAWSLVNPLLQLLVFGFVFKFVLAVAVPRYSAYAFTGMLVWSWFQMSLVQGARAITGNRDLVKRPAFPAAILPVVAVTTNLVQFVLAFPILGLLLVWTKSPLSPSVVTLPLVIACQFVLMLSLSYLLAAVNVIFQDTQHILGVLLQLLLFLTPIFYELKNVPAAFQPLHQLNPLGQLVDAYRAILLQGAWPSAMPLLALSLAAALLLHSSYHLFIRMSHRFAEET